MPFLGHKVVTYRSFYTCCVFKSHNIFQNTIPNSVKKKKTLKISIVIMRLYDRESEMLKKDGSFTTNEEMDYYKLTSIIGVII